MTSMINCFNNDFKFIREIFIERFIDLRATTTSFQNKFKVQDENAEVAKLRIFNMVIEGDGAIS